MARLRRGWFRKAAAPIGERARQPPAPQPTTQAGTARQRGRCANADSGKQPRAQRPQHVSRAAAVLERRAPRAGRREGPPRWLVLAAPEARRRPGSRKGEKRPPKSGRQATAKADVYVQPRTRARGRAAAQAQSGPSGRRTQFHCNTHSGPQRLPAPTTRKPRRGRPGPAAGSSSGSRRKCSKRGRNRASMPVIRKGGQRRCTPFRAPGAAAPRTRRPRSRPIHRTPTHPGTSTIRGERPARTTPPRGWRPPTGGPGRGPRMAGHRRLPQRVQAVPLGTGAARRWPLPRCFWRGR